MIVSDLIGRPYTAEHDCNWLASEMASRCERSYPPDVKTPADKDDWPEMFRVLLAEHYHKVIEPKVGDLAIFAIPMPGHKIGWHCGTIIEPGLMITTRLTVGVHIVKLNTPMWRVWLKGYYEFKD